MFDIKNIFSKISGVQRAEDKIEKYQERLEGFVQKRSVELQKTNEELKQKIIAHQKLEDSLKEKTQELVESLENVEHEKNKLDIIMQSIGDGVLVVNRELKTVVFNKAASVISGFSSKEVIGKKYSDIIKFIYEKNKEVNNEFILTAFREGKVTHIGENTLLLNKDGKEIPVGDSAAPIKNREGKAIGCVVVFRDISKERELQKLKDEFLNIAAHDLRTPMTAVKGYTDMILSGDFGEVAPKMREPLSEIAQASDRMIRLISDFLTVSRIERGKITVNPKPINLGPVLTSITKQIEPIASKKNLTFYTEDLPKDLWVNADSDKIQQVIINLLDNAIKYTDKGSVTFRAEVGSNSAVISVSDTGVGIRKENQAKLFDKYYQVNENAMLTEGKGSGLGLGLYICRLIIEGCGGKIWAESELGKGSKFSFSLPLINK